MENNEANKLDGKNEQEGKRNMNDKASCFICDADCSDNPHEIIGFYPFPVRNCCLNHKKYEYSQIGLMLPFLRKELGFSYDESEIEVGNLECCVCRNKLTQNEIDRIKSTDKNFYCTEHEEIKFCYAWRWARAWFVYKEQVNPNATVIGEKDSEDSKDWEDFERWYLDMGYDGWHSLMFNGRLICEY